MKQARRHARQRAQIINQTDATLQEVLSQVSSTEAIKLLLWCISAVVPFHYICGATTMATQQDEGIPIISGPCPTVPEPEPPWSLAPGPSGDLTPPPVTSPLPMPSLPDIPLAGTPLLEHPSTGLLAIPPEGKWDYSPSDSPNHFHAKRICITSSEVKVGSEHSSPKGNDHMPDLTFWTGSRWQRQESPSPSPSPTRGPTDPDNEAVTGSPKSTKDWIPSDSGLSKGNMVNSRPGHSLWRLPLLLRHRWHINMDGSLEI